MTNGSPTLDQFFDDQILGSKKLERTPGFIQVYYNKTLMKPRMIKRLFTRSTNLSGDQIWSTNDSETGDE